MIVLLAALIALITALVPLLKWAWRKHGVRRFDAKKDHYNELIERAKWWEDRLFCLDTLRKQWLYAKMYEPLDGFKLAELVSKLDRKDAEWARKIDDAAVLAQACEQKQDECQKNAEQNPPVGRRCRAQGPLLTSQSQGKAARERHQSSGGPRSIIGP
jgi:hypothetical protein